MIDQEPAFTKRAHRQTRSDGSIKMREIAEPSLKAREQHSTMLRVFYHFFDGESMPHATGSVPGKQLIDNVMPHRLSNSFYQLDLKDAFANVDIDVLIEKLMNSGRLPARWNYDVEKFVLDWGRQADIPGLPQGAPCSPVLFNFYCLEMDRVLGKYCEDSGITYTRYLDDLTFSAPTRLGKKRRGHIRNIIANHSAGLEINHSKSRLHSLDNGPVTITGISIQTDRRLQPSPELIKKARQVFEDGTELTSDLLFMFDEEVGRLHGWNGVIQQLSAPDQEPSHTLSRLNRKYYRALGKLGQKT